MKQEEFTATIIEAEEGYFLTQAEEVELLKRIICKKVALGRYDTPENWKEITAEEAEQIRGQQKQLRNNLEAQFLNGFANSEDNSSISKDFSTKPPF